MDSTDRIFVDFSAKKLRQLAGRIETCLGKLTPEQVWSRGSEQENAVGNLVLHLCGNVRQWIIAGVGGAPDIRQRNAEFDARGGESVSALVARLRDVTDEAGRIIESVPASRLSELIHVQGYDMPVLEAIYHVVEHFSGHTGQIIFVTKMVTTEDLGFYRHLRATGHAEKTP